MKPQIDNVLIALSALTVIVSGYVFLTQQEVFNLAGTQWILIAIVLGIYGMYAKMQRN